MAASGNRLQLEVIGAQNLRYNKRILRRQDPYVMVEIGGETFKSKVAKKTGTDPTWNEELETQVQANSGPAKITVYDKNIMAQDDVLGVATYDFTNARGQQETIRLMSPEGEHNGELFVIATYGGSGQSGRGVTSGATAGATTGITTGGASAGITTGANRAGVGDYVQSDAPAGVCHREFFTKVEDRPIVKERVERIREHIPVEREMVAEVRSTGREQELPDRTAESLGIQERVVDVKAPAKCP